MLTPRLVKVNGETPEVGTQVGGLYRRPTRWRPIHRLSPNGYAEKKAESGAPFTTSTVQQVLGSCASA